MSDDAQDRDGIVTEMHRDAGLAVSTAEGFGVALDFSTESIGALERLVPRVVSLGGRASADDADRHAASLRGVIKAWGADIGETLRRCHGGTWTRDEYGLGVLLPTGVTAHPHNKVEKRLRDGPGDSLTGFFAMVARPELGQVLRERPDAP